MDVPLDFIVIILTCGVKIIAEKNKCIKSREEFGYPNLLQDKFFIVMDRANSSLKLLNQLRGKKQIMPKLCCHTF